MCRFKEDRSENTIWVIRSCILNDIQQANKLRKNSIGTFSKGGPVDGCFECHNEMVRLWIKSDNAGLEQATNYPS